jgi:hypothetical protein
LITGNPFDPGHPEFVYPHEIAEARRQAHQAMEAWAQERARTFRIDVVQQLGQLGAMQEGMSWAVYDLTEGEDGAVATVDAANAAHGLLLAFRRREGTDEALSVRLIKDSFFSTINKNMACMAEQVMVDEDNDIHYGVYGAQVNPDKNSIKTSYFPLFKVTEEGELGGHFKMLKSYEPLILITEDEAFAQRSNSPYWWRQDAGVVMLGGVQATPMEAFDGVNRAYEMLAEITAGRLIAFSASTA